MSLFIDIHVLQTVPPSNLNRDDTGSPKTAVFGGVRRARVSSQAWKRATRRDFSSRLDRSDVGVRTKRAVELLAARITQREPVEPEVAAKRAEAVLGKAGLKVKAARKAVEGDLSLTEYLVFLSNGQLDRLAEAAIPLDADLDARTIKSILQKDQGIDVALFGRMVADDAELNVDAACQVAHALSTHAVQTEYDYYTAVDDEAPAGETGAGMIGTIEFDSATLYRYATINVPALKANLGDDLATVRAVEAFVRSFVTSMPTGKQNTFANRTTPDAVVVMAREDQPVNLVGAFEDAVPAKGGYVEGSAKALADQAADVASAFGSPPQAAWVTTVGAKTAALSALGQGLPFDALVTAVGAYTQEALGSQG